MMREEVRDYLFKNRDVLTGKTFAEMIEERSSMHGLITGLYFDPSNTDRVEFMLMDVTLLGIPAPNIRLENGEYVEVPIREQKTTGVHGISVRLKLSEILIEDTWIDSNTIHIESMHHGDPDTCSGDPEVLKMLLELPPVHVVLEIQLNS